MNVLIVESHAALGALWRNHLVRQGMSVTLCQSQAEAIAHLGAVDTQIVILNLVLEDGSAIAVADYASYRQPDAKVIFVTNTSFFSDGSIFSHAANACALLPTGTPPEDLAAMVEHYAGEAARA